MSAETTSRQELPPHGARTARVRLRDSPAISVCIALTLAAVFLPTVIVPYAFSDDYLLLGLVNRVGLSDPGYPKSIINAAVVNGRPIAGLVDTWSFGAAERIANLRFV